MIHSADQASHLLVKLYLAAERSFKSDVWGHPSAGTLHGQSWGKQWDRAGCSSARILWSTNKNWEHGILSFCILQQHSCIEIPECRMRMLTANYMVTMWGAQMFQKSTSLMMVSDAHTSTWKIWGAQWEKQRWTLRMNWNKVGLSGK